MSDFYAILGVAPNASQAEIKAAYRRRSSEAHPDREGGDSEQQSEINRAYECLSDAEKRAHYDRTGAPPAPMDNGVREMLFKAFEKVLDQNIVSDRLGFVRRIVMNEAKEYRASKKAALKDRERFVIERDKVRTKSTSTRNVFQAMIDRRFEIIDAHVKNADDMLEICAAALKVLEDYESEEALPSVVPVAVYVYSLGNHG